MNETEQAIQQEKEAYRHLLESVKETLKQPQHFTLYEPVALTPPMLIEVTFINGGTQKQGWINPKLIAFATQEGEHVRIDFANGHSRIVSLEDWERVAIGA